MTTFAALLDQAHHGALELPGSWLQGRTAFGGLQAGALVARARREAGGRPLRALMTAFVGPAAQGPATVDAELLRAGGSSSQVQARLIQGDALCATALALFGAPRAGQPSYGDPAPFQALPPDALAELPQIPGVTPVFTQHFDYRWAEGQPPFSAADSSAIGGWIRFREPPAALGAEALLALLDAWPVPVLSTFRAPGPASTVTWHAQLFDVGELDPGEHLAYRGRTTAGSDGYVDAQAELRTADGRLLVTSTQSVAIYHP